MFNNKNMKKYLTTAEAGKMGGKKRWENVPPEERSKTMKEVRLAGIKKIS
jgi:hypothetical protein